MPPIPPLPPRFGPDAVPVGVEVRFVPFVETRPLIKPNAVHGHTNGASRELDVDDSYNYAVARPGTNTLPHYQVDMTHEGKARACKFLPTDRRGIGSTTVGKSTRYPDGRLIWPTLTLNEQQEIEKYGNVRDRTIVIETADTGYLRDPTVSAYDPGQLEMLATIIAFECVVWDIPILFQPDWMFGGIGSHTDPKGFPFTTIHRGKICPGDKKKTQMRTVIIDRVEEIVKAWTGVPAPLPPPIINEEDDVAKLARNKNNIYELRVGNGSLGVVYRSDEYAHLATCSPEEFASYGFISPTTGKPMVHQNEVPVISDRELDLRVGYIVPGVGAADEG